MAEFKVREVDFEEKSVQETEEALLQDHAEKQEEVVGESPVEENIVSATVEVKEENPTPVAKVDGALTDDSVLSYIKDRYGKEVNNLNDLFEAQASNEDLPEDVATFLKYKKDTGRGIEDFLAINKDYDSADPDDVLYEYWKQTKPHLDDDDIDFEIESRFNFDEELDDEGEIKKRKIAKKEELVKAKEYLNKLKEQYQMPLESRAKGATEVDEGYEAYKKYVEESQSLQELNEKRRKVFEEQTNKIFNEDFEGFNFRFFFLQSPRNLSNSFIAPSKVE